MNSKLVYWRMILTTVHLRLSETCHKRSGEIQENRLGALATELNLQTVDPKIGVFSVSVVMMQVVG